MEKFNMAPRFYKAAALAGIGLLGLSACGQTDPPSPNEFKNDIEYVELDDVRAANGEPVRCVMYGSESGWTQDSKAWFGFDCDFEGTAIFPDEVIGG